MTVPPSDSCQYLEFERHNVGAGGETLDAMDVATDSDYALVVLLDNHYCSLSRELVRRLVGRYDEFETRETSVVTVLPDIRERAQMWDRQYDLPFALLADPDQDAVPTETFDSFDSFDVPPADGPTIALFDCADDRLQYVTTVDSDGTSTVDAALTAIDDCHDARAATE